MIPGQRGRLKRTKRLSQMKPGYKCKWCGGNDHTSFSCYKKPQKKIRVESKKTFDNRIATRKLWLDQNPPDDNGYWECYLRIASDCPRLVDHSGLQLEHVRSKTRHPALKFVVQNIKSSCRPCNKLKASWSVLELAETYPHLFDLVTTPEWQTYEQLLDKLEAA